MPLLEAYVLHYQVDDAGDDVLLIDVSSVYIQNGWVPLVPGANGKILLIQKDGKQNLKLWAE